MHRVLVPVALAAAISLTTAGCGGDDTARAPSPSRSETSTSPQDAAPDVDASTEPTDFSVEPRSYPALSLTGLSFNGGFIDASDRRALALGDSDATLGQALAQVITLYAADGRVIATADMSDAPDYCDAVLAGTDEEPSVWYLGKTYAEAEGITDATTTFVLQQLDETLTPAEPLDLETGPLDEVDDYWEQHAKDCQLTRTTDGRYIVASGVSGWFLVDTATGEPTRLADYAVPEIEDGSPEVSIAAFGTMLLRRGANEITVLDPADPQGPPLHTYAAEDPSYRYVDSVIEAEVEGGQDAGVSRARGGVYFADYESGKSVYLDIASGAITRSKADDDRGVALPGEAAEAVFYFDDDGVTAVSEDLQNELWTAPNVDNVCAVSSTQVVVSANDQLALLDMASGEQIDSNSEDATSGIFGGSVCASIRVAGFGWDIQDDAVRGDGGEILSYFEQSVED